MKTIGVFDCTLLDVYSFILFSEHLCRRISEELLFSVYFNKEKRVGDNLPKRNKKQTQAHTLVWLILFLLLTQE